MTVFSRITCAFQVKGSAADRSTSPVTGSIIAVTSDPAKQTICIEGPTAPPQLPKGPGFLAGMLDEREVAQRPLQSDDLTRDKLCNSQADDIGDGTHHGMVSGVVTSGSADVGVRVDPQHRKIIPIAVGQPGEWRHAH